MPTPAMRDCHPSYWAEFVLVGDYAPVPLQRKPPEQPGYLLLALGAIAAILLALWWFFARK